MAAAIDFRFLADVDATLNAIATVLIVLGIVAAKRGRIELHKRLMLAATCVSALFLCCYLLYHATCEPVKFRGEGAAKTAYFALLISHVVLAAVQVPLILRTLWLGLKDRREQHRRWARITAPIWLYVSVTGVLVYWMLYHW